MMEEIPMNKDFVLKAPHDCYIILTSKCNQRCIHCYGKYGEKDTNNELTGAEWDHVFKDLVESNVFYVNISGGEPTQHSDFDEIIYSLRKRELHYILTTNGLCNAGCLESIISSKDMLIGLKISLDGPNAASHSYIRRDIHGEKNENHFFKTLSTIYQLKSKGVPVTIATCIHPENIYNMNEFLKLILDIKPISWYISTISLSGRALNNLESFSSESQIDVDEWLHIKSICEDNDIFVNFIDMPSIDKKKSEKILYYECPAANWFCEISSTGLVTPCPLARVAIKEDIICFENIRDKRIIDIWNGEPFNQFRALGKQGCDGCIAKDKCGRCIPQSIQWFDKPDLPPPFCIKHGQQLNLLNLDRLQNLLEKKMIYFNRENYI